jgi:hypothetical protein
MVYKRADVVAERCGADAEFRMAARYWTGSLRLEIGEEVIDLRIDDGVISAGGPDRPPGKGAGHIGLAGPDEVWNQLLAPVPRPFFNDIMPAQAFGLRHEGDAETMWQYYPAVRRLVELMRTPA